MAGAPPFLPFRYGLVAAVAAMILAVAALLAGGCAHERAFDRAPGADREAYWCPMHPDVRGHRGDTCSLCGMALVAASTADYRPYLLDVELLPRTLAARQPGKIRFHVLDPRTRQPVTAFEPLHERLFHLFVVSHDLEYFAHLHPELRADGSLDVDVEVPRPGAYRLIADFLPIGGPPQLIERSFITAGYAGTTASVARTLEPDGAEKMVEGTRVALIIPPPVAGREQLVTFELTDQRTGQPVTDLEPYLAATGHLLVVSSDLAVAFHSHPVAEITSQFGPSIVFQMLFPRAGAYRMWVQYQRQGTVGTAAFTVVVRDREQ